MPHDRAAILGSCLTDALTRPGFALQHPRATAWLLVGLIFVVPIAGAFVVHYWTAMRLHPTFGLMRRFSAYDPTPTAWNFASDRMDAGFIRVLTKADTWLGGCAAPESYFTGYPETREILLQQASELDDDDGVFIKAVDGTAGVWIRCDDVQIVQFLEPEDGHSEAHFCNADRRLGAADGR